MRITIFITYVILIAVNSLLTYIDDSFINSLSYAFWKDVFTWIKVHKLHLTIPVNVFIALTGLYFGSRHWVTTRQYNSELRRNIMETMLGELFNNNKQSTRITIFKDASPFRILLYLIYQNKLKALLFWKLGWHPISGRYIMIKERVGLYHEKSKTFFKYTDQTDTGCQGIAGRVRFQREAICITQLPDIRNIDLESIKINSKARDAQNIREYMKRGHVDFETLKRINVKSLHFYGDVLYNQESRNKGKPQGILIVDSVEPESPFTEEVIQKISIYSELLSYTL